MVTCHDRAPTRSARARFEPTRPSDSGRLRDLVASRRRWTPCPVWTICGRQGTRKLSNTSTNPPEARGTVRATGLTPIAGRSPAVVPVVRLQAGEHGGGGVLSRLLTVAVTERTASFPIPSGESAVTTNRWLPSGHPSESQGIAKPLV